MNVARAIFILEILGTISFATSGAMLGIQKKLDLFGVIVLGITTSVGGGLIRDVVLGITPPGMFRDPRYTLTAVITSLVLFIFLWIRSRLGRKHILLGEAQEDSIRSWFNHFINLCDMIGLGLFTVIGMNTAILSGFGDHRFLMIFVGVITGVGGGLLRDMMVGVTPYIFVKHIYAVASLAGALTALLLWKVLLLPWFECMIMGALAVIVIRALAVHYQWNLPRIS